MTRFVRLLLSFASAFALTIAIAVGIAGCTPQRTDTAPRGRAVSPARLQGDWQVESTLRVREGLKGPSQYLLAVSKQLQAVLDGDLKLEGLPPMVAGIVGGLVSQVLKKQVPAWTQQLLQRIAKLSEAINDTRIESVETLHALGAGRYKGRSRWVRVTVTSGTLKVTATPRDIPGLGELSSEPYTAVERDGRLYIQPHRIHQQLGKLYRWGTEALLSGITCSIKTIPCFKTVEALLDALLDCKKLTQLVSGANPTLVGLKPLIQAGCQSQKQSLVAKLRKKIDELTLTLTYLRLQGNARIDGHRLVDGRWHGTLGKAYGKGAFGGTFTGVYVKH